MLDKTAMQLRKVNYEKGNCFKLNFNRVLFLCVNFCIIYKKAQLSIISFLSFGKFVSEMWKKTTKPRIITLTTERATEPYHDQASFSPGFEDENH